MTATVTDPVTAALAVVRRAEVQVGIHALAAALRGGDSGAIGADLAAVVADVLGVELGYGLQADPDQPHLLQIGGAHEGVLLLDPAACTITDRGVTRSAQRQLDCALTALVAALAAGARFPA